MTVGKAETVVISKCMEFRIKPTMEQKVLIWKTFGCCRFVWNHLLDERISYEKMNKGKLLNSTPAHLKKNNPFLSEVDSMALINTQLNLNQACRKLFAKGKSPKFRAKGKDRRSYTTNWINNNIGIIHVSDTENYIKLPKLGSVRIILHRRIAKEQRKLSRMQYGSANYWQEKHRIGKLHEKAGNRRKDFLHKLSHKVANDFDAVIVEDINLQHMAQSLNFGKAVYDNGYGKLRTMLAYKLNDSGKILVKVDRIFPSSRRCSVCHDVNHELRLADREWTCKSCGTHHDRDKNATRNLLDEGKDILNRWASGDSSLILAPTGVLSGKKLTVM